MFKLRIDIGGMKIAGVVNSRGYIVGKLRIDTAELAQAVIDMDNHLLATHDAVAVGVAGARFIDDDRTREPRSRDHDDPRASFAIAQFGNDAGLIGAADLAIAGGSIR